MISVAKETNKVLGKSYFWQVVKKGVSEEMAFKTIPKGEEKAEMFPEEEQHGWQRPSGRNVWGPE